MALKKLNILFVTPYVPRLRPNNFIKQLSIKGHSIYLACLVQPKWEIVYLNELEAFCKAIYPVFPKRLLSYFRAVLSLPSRTPLSVAFSSSIEMQKNIKKLIKEKKFDIVHTEFIRAAQYTYQIRDIPKLYDSVDSLSLAYSRAIENKYTQSFHRILAYEELFKMRNYEPGMIRSFDRVIVSSPSDQGSLANCGLKVDIVSNGVDLDYFYWSEEEKEEDSLVFLGKMNYYVNVDCIHYFCTQIYPLIKAQRPKVHLTIVGVNPTHSVRALAKDPSITVTGAVSDVRPYLSRAMVAIAPMISGSGIQNKILQSMAVGTPVVTTSLACQALHVENGEHLVVADNPHCFSRAVIDLLMDKTLRRKLSINARDYVVKFHNWKTIGQRLEDIYMELIH